MEHSVSLRSRWSGSPFTVSNPLQHSDFMGICMLLVRDLHTIIKMTYRELKSL